MVTDMIDAKKFSTADQAFRIMADIASDETDETINFDVWRYGDQFVIEVTENDEVIGYL